MDEDWETLRTYEEVLAELNRNGEPEPDGYQTLLQQAQRYGG
jgi:hypothetical protein